MFGAYAAGFKLAGAAALVLVVGVGWATIQSLRGDLTEARARATSLQLTLDAYTENANRVAAIVATTNEAAANRTAEAARLSEVINNVPTPTIPEQCREAVNASAAPIARTLDFLRSPTGP